uniref:arylamine N-acetyltransferase n=1 Tax=Ciona intestinalis TaxID=7719 RepID=D8FT00_CIOIN|nr:arylamine N-acetyltransferase 2 [Ciona intestinalis]CBL43390.1 TPA: arylamine N-acetyltransferase 2 [Ciona intestinalis]|eukprot:XP_002124392.1 arylamine N-acetyltransferase 2 [Ciona intestinalis]
MDVQMYLDRINYKGTREPSLENLRKLCLCHVTHVPQDTIDMFGGKMKKLDLKKIFNDIVVNKRGGFCYEANGLFCWLLKELGFGNVTIFQASAFQAAADKFHFEFDHLMMKVTFPDSDYLVDIGYGAPSFFMPFKFEDKFEHHEMSGMYRLRKVSEHVYYVEKHKKKLWTKKGTTDTDYKLTSSTRDDGNTTSKYCVDPNWNIVFKFSTVPHKYEDFSEAINKHMDPKEFLSNNSFLEIFVEGGALIMWGTMLIRKRFVGELTEYIDYEELWDENINDEKNWERIYSVMKTEFGVEVDFQPKLMSRNLHIAAR